MFEEVPIESSIASFVSRIKEAFANGEYAEIGAIIGGKINEVFQTIHNYVQWDNVGATLTKYIGAFCETFNSLVDAINWDLIGSTFAAGINTIVNSLYLLLTGIDWTSLGAAFSEGLNGLIQNVDWEKFGGTIGEYFDAKLHLLYGAVTNFDWVALGQSLAQAITGFTQSIDWSAAGEALSTGIKGAFTLLWAAITEFDWQQLGSDVGTFISNIDWGGIINTALTVLLSLPKAIFDLISSAISSTDWVGIASGIAEGIKDAVINFDFEGTFASFGELIGNALKAALDIAKWIGEAICDGVEAAKSYFAEKIEECGGDVAAGILKGIGDALANIKAWIEENIVDPFINGFKSVFGIHSPSTVMAELGGYLIEGLLNGINDTWSDLTDFLTDALDTIWEKFSNTWEDIKATASDAAANVYDTVSQKFSDVHETISDKVDAAKTAVQEAFATAKGAATAAAEDIYTDVSTSFSDVYNTISGKVGSIVTEVSNGFADVKEDIVTKLNDAMSELSDLDWQSVGGDICSGISNGISSGWNWLNEKVSGLADSLLKSAKDALDIHSPSRLFRDEVGLMLGLGVAEGIDDAESSILTTVSGIAGEIANEFSTGSYTVPKIGIGGITGTLNGFAAEISGSFSNLVDTLNAIAARVTFTMPTVAAGAVLPYAVAAKSHAAATESDVGAVISDNIKAGNTELIAAILTVADRVITAIEENGGPVQIGDDEIGRAYDRYNRRRGVRVNSGVFANAY